MIANDFEPDLVAELLGRPRLALLKRLSHLERKHRLIHSVGRRCRFDHQQLRETLYRELMDGLRDEYHALVGEALERRLAQPAAAGGSSVLTGSNAVAVARHLLLGRRLDEAARHLSAALSHALATYATEDGELLARTFLDLDEAAGRTQPPALRVEALLAYAECLGHDGRRAEERDVLERAADAVAATDDATLQRRTLERRLSLHFGLGEFPRAEVVCREAFKTVTRSKDRAAAIAALGNLGGALRSQGRFDDAVNALRRALSWVVPEADPLRRCLLTTSLGLVQVARGHVPSAQRLYLQARAIAESFGLRAGERVRIPKAQDTASLRYQFAGLARALGRYAESRVDAERTLLLATNLPTVAREGAALLALGLLAGHLDQLGDARAALELARERAAEAGDRRFESAIVQALGESAVQAMDTERARHHFAHALGIRRSIGYRPGVCESLLALGQVAAMGGDVDAARLHVEEALELAPALEMPGIAALAGATAALLYAREGRRDHARKELEQAHRALGGDGPLSVSSRAEGLYFAAMASRALGDEDTCRAYMWQAYDLVQEIAERLPADQRAQFLKGTSPNREIVTAVAALT